jgi:quinol monooxygenase YgiN
MSTALVAGCTAESASLPASATEEAASSASSEDDGGAWVIATAEFAAKDGREDDVVRAMQDVEVATAMEPGVLYANVHRNIDDAHAFLAFGVWKDAAAFEAHGQSAHAAAFRAAVADALTGPLVLSVYSSVTTLDLARMRATAQDPDALYTLVTAQAKSAADKSTFLGLVSDLVPTFRAQDGGRFYDVLDGADATAFASYESWTGLDAENAHLASAPVQDFLAKVCPTLVGPPKFEHWKSIARAVTMP